jgi:hypothetical protein
MKGNSQLRDSSGFPPDSHFNRLYSEPITFLGAKLRKVKRNAKEMHAFFISEKEKVQHRPSYKTKESSANCSL